MSDYKILRDGVEVAQVTNWPEKFYPDGGVTIAFADRFTGLISNAAPGTYLLCGESTIWTLRLNSYGQIRQRSFRMWEAISL